MRRLEYYLSLIKSNVNKMDCLTLPGVLIPNTSSIDFKKSSRKPTYSPELSRDPKKPKLLSLGF